MNLKRIFRNPLVIVIVIFLITFGLFYFCGLWLLSDASPYIYKKLYPPVNTHRDTLIVSNLPVQMNDTLYIGKQRIVSHKGITLPQAHVESIKDCFNPSAEQLGALGDSAGLWNALFSGLALIGVIISIFYQTHRDKKNENAIRVSRFRDEFYRLLDCISKVVVDIEIRISTESSQAIEWQHMLQGTAYDRSQQDEPLNQNSSDGKSIRGRACFKYVYAEQPNSIAEAGMRPDGANYETLESHFADYFSHYFRLLYRLLRYIDNSDDIKDISDKDKIKEECFGILKAHLSTFELLVIFYNGLLKKNHKAKSLYEKAKIFDNLNIEYLTFPNERQYYKAVKQALTIDDVPKENLPLRYYEPSAFVKLNKKPFQLAKWIRAKNNQLIRFAKSFFNKGQAPIPWDEKIFLEMIGSDEELTQRKLQRRLPFKESILNGLIERLRNEKKLIQVIRKGKTYYKRVK